MEIPEVSRASYRTAMRIPWLIIVGALFAAVGFGLVEWAFTGSRGEPAWIAGVTGLVLLLLGWTQERRR